MPIIQPDNFLYFIVLFALSIIAGTYLLFVHYINRLLIFNVIIFLMCAIRLCTEYYLPEVEEHAFAQHITNFHGLPANLLVALQWYCIWAYVRPLKGWKWEQQFGYFFTYGLLVIPFLLHSYFMFTTKIFYLNEVKMDGYWRFAIDTDFWYYPIYRHHIDWTLLLVALFLLIGIIRNPQHRIRQSLLLLSYAVFPFIHFAMTVEGEWNIPSTGFLYVGHTIIISWYVSNYRLFGNNFRLYTKDVFNSISDLTISTDTKLRITNYNNKTRNAFRIDQSNLIAVLEEHLVTNQIVVKDAIQQLLNDELEEIELALFDQQQQQRIFEVKVSPFKNGDRLLGYTFLLTDLTDIRQKEKELEQLNATKDRLFAIIGHDLRNPSLAFRGIGKKMDYLLQKEDYVTLNKLTMSLEKAAFSLNSLLDNLLNWALQQRDVLSYHPQPVRIKEATAEIEQYFSEIAASKNIQISFDIDEQTQIFVDPNAFMTIVRNLVDNAVKFTPEKGAIKVTDEVKEHEVVLKVEDNGIGISATELPHLFQLNGKRSRKGTHGESGTGLGLSLVQELVKLNKGAISVKSQLQQGTIFKVSLPVA